MKTVFIILVLLAVAEWKKKEACKTKGRGWTWYKKDGKALVSDSQGDDGYLLAATTNDVIMDDIDDDENNSPVDYDNQDLLPYITRPESDQNPSVPALVRKCHVLIIGAGAETVALLGSLKVTMLVQKKRTLNNRIHVIIVEKKSKFGPGNVYDGDEVNPEHLTDNFLLTHLSINNDYLDFKNWDDETADWDEENEEYQEQLEYRSPRRAVGRYLEQRFGEYVEDRKFMKITEINETSADRVSRGDGKTIVVKLSDGSEVHTTDIVLATGHWHNSPFGKEEVKGFFPSPWPASALTHSETGIPANAKVGIRGDGRNAIDAILTLAHTHGNFTPAKHKEHGFDYKPKSDDFHITMYSRWGHLPAVSVKLMKYVFSDITKNAEKNIQSLDELMELLRDDLARSVSGVPKFTNAKEFMQNIDEHIYVNEGKRAQERLVKDIKVARVSWVDEDSSDEDSSDEDSSVDEGSSVDEDGSMDKDLLVFQYFFVGMLEYFDKTRFSPKDLFTFETEIAPRILNFARPMPLVTAEKLLAMMEANRLLIMGTGAKSEILKGRNNKGVNIKYGKGRYAKNTHYDYFVDATEQSGDIKSNPSPLVKSLFENKFIQPNYLDLHPLPNDDKRIEKVDTMLRDNSTKKSRKVTKKFYRSDGVKMDMNNMRVIPPDNAPPELRPPPKDVSDDPNTPPEAATPCVIFATGPFAYHAFGESLPRVVELADEISNDILKRVSKYEERDLDPPKQEDSQTSVRITP